MSSAEWLESAVLFAVDNSRLEGMIATEQEIDDAKSVLEGRLAVDEYAARALRRLSGAEG